MPHASGRIYLVTSTNPHQGVSIADVQQTLARGVNDLGLLCSDQEWDNTSQSLRPANKINMWAKYRPIEKANFKGILTDAMRKTENWGIGNIPLWSSETLANAANFWAKSSGVAPDCGLKTAYWTKVLPSTQYRLLDFASTEHIGKGYWHGAEAPISKFLGSLAIPPTNQLDVIYLRGAEADETILLSDIGSFEDYYFGVLFVEDNGTNIYIFTQEYTMDSPSWTQDFAVHIANAKASIVPSGTSKNWYVFPILCANSFTTLTEVHSDLTERTIVALLPATLESISAQGFAYTLLADSASLSNNTISYSFYFANNDTNGLAVDVQLGYEFRTQLGEVVATAQSTTVNVAAGNNYTFTGAQNLGSLASSVYSVAAYIKYMSAQNYAVEWAEAVVGQLPLI